jgi:hypothetical protein
MYGRFLLNASVLFIFLHKTLNNLYVLGNQLYFFELSGLLPELRSFLFE